MEECKHVVAYGFDPWDSRYYLIDNNRDLSTAENVTKFQYCPLCGKEIGD